MQVILNPNRSEWKELVKRPVQSIETLNEIVNQIFSEVKTKGDKAVQKYTHFFDKTDLENFILPDVVWEQLAQEVSVELKDAIQLAKQNIEKFHLAQKEDNKKIETTEGVVCWRVSRAIEKVGIYVPGGTAPLFSTVLMLGIPAKLAGCKEIILCTPPDKNGRINPAIAYAAKLVGVTKIITVGGVQAVAALTFGTKTIPQVFKIVGPGNQFVTAAKQKAQKFGVAIDMPAGPSEVLVIADDSSVPAFVAADLLSQAEHGLDSQVILLSDSKVVIGKVQEELEKQLGLLPRKDIAQKALQNSRAICLETISECIDFSNLYAPEHLILASERAENWFESIENAGSVFVGNYSCESAGDYASGTNHTLPTNGYARNYSGVSLDTFLKKITFQKLTENGLGKIGPAIEVMAEAEGLVAHKNAVTIRLKSFAENAALINDSYQAKNQK